MLRSLMIEYCAWPIGSRRTERSRKVCSSSVIPQLQTVLLNNLQIASSLQLSSGTGEPLANCKHSNRPPNKWCWSVIGVLRKVLICSGWEQSSFTVTFHLNLHVLSNALVEWTALKHAGTCEMSCLRRITITKGNGTSVS